MQKYVVLLILVIVFGLFGLGLWGIQNDSTKLYQNTTATGGVKTSGIELFGFDISNTQGAIILLVFAALAGSGILIRYAK